MYRIFARAAVPAAAAFLALLGAAAPARADAIDDVKLVNEPTAVVLRSDTYLENTNAAKAVTATVVWERFQGSARVGGGFGVYELKPGERRLIGHAQESLLLTKFTITGAVYKP